MGHERDEVFDKFNRYYPVIADRVIDWYRSGRNSIVVVMDDESRMEYHYILNTVRNLVDLTEDDFDSEDNYQRDFSYNLMCKMADAGVNRGLLAEKTGISQVSISKYLNRKTLPSIYNCEKIARALNCSVSELTKQSY